MKLVPLVLALSAAFAAGDAVAASVDVFNCSDPGGTGDVAAFNGNDVVRIVASSDRMGLRPGQSVTLTCATEFCAVRFEFPQSVGRGGASSSSGAFSTGLSAVSGTLFAAKVTTRVCFTVRYDANGNKESVATATYPSCACEQ